MLETRMTELAAADAPAAHDPAFTHAVMARIARRRAPVRLMQECVVMGGATVALAAAAPFVGRVAAMLGQVSQGALNMAGLIAVTTLMIAVGLVPAWLVMRRG